MSGRGMLLGVQKPSYHITIVLQSRYHIITGALAKLSCNYGHCSQAKLLLEAL